MSTIEPSTQGMIVPKNIAGRIMEIMEEKGKAFTQQALATRIGMSRQTLAMKLRGERDLYLFELRRIAEALHLPVERVMQEDTRDDEKRLNEMFAHLLEYGTNSKHLPNFDEMRVIAERLSSIAIGATERCKSLNDLGRVYYNLRRYDEAYKTFLQAHEYAKKIDKKSNNQEFQSLVLSNLLVLLTLTNNPIESIEILDEIERIFNTSPHRLGIVYYVRAKLAEVKKDIYEAKIHAAKSLEYFIQTKNVLSIGRAEATLAHFEFLSGNYADSLYLLENSIKNQETQMHGWLISIKDYSKTLLKLQKVQQMENVVLDALKQIKPYSSQFRDIVGKLHLLLSIGKNEPSHAEKVLFDNRIDVNIRKLAYKYLKRQCIQNGDKDTLMKYAIIEDELETTKRDLLDEELF